MKTMMITIQWHHNERDGVSKHRRLHCLLNCWLRRRSKKTSKLRVTGLCAVNSPVTGEFPEQKASNAENDDVTMICAVMMETKIYIAFSWSIWSNWHNMTVQPHLTQNHRKYDNSGKGDKKMRWRPLPWKLWFVMMTTLSSTGCRH